MLTWFLAALTSLTTSQSASVPLRPVTVDWSGVSDATVERCGLTTLQSLLLQTLLESGFAVVDAAGPQVTVVELVEERGAVTIVARREARRAERRLGIPRRCDSSFGVDLQAAVRAVALEVEAQTREAPSEPVSVPAPLLLRASEQEASEPSDALLRFGAGGSMSWSSSPFFTFGVQLARRTGPWMLGVLFDAAARRGRDVSVLEPGLGITAERELLALEHVVVSAGVCAQALGHVFTYGDQLDGHLDGRLCAPLRWEHVASGLGLSLTSSYRLRPVEHRRRGALAYEVGRLGFSAALTWRLAP